VYVRYKKVTVFVGLNEKMSQDAARVLENFIGTMNLQGY
jgi:hypothetical protein